MLTRERFACVAADPPWLYQNWSANEREKRGDTFARRWGRCTYPSMKLADICSLPVASLCEKDAVLILWATWPKLEEAMEVMRRWGFRYRTGGFVWLKRYRNGRPVCGMGRWTRKSTEFSILGTRGHPKRLDNKVLDIIETQDVLQHSKKPEECQDRIERLVKGPYLELFASRQREGWTCLGMDVTGNDIRADIARLLGQEEMVF